VVLALMLSTSNALDATGYVPFHDMQTVNNSEAGLSMVLNECEVKLSKVEQGVWQSPIDVETYRCWVEFPYNLLTYFLLSDTSIYVTYIHKVEYDKISGGREEVVTFFMRASRIFENLYLRILHSVWSAIIAVIRVFSRSSYFRACTNVDVDGSTSFSTTIFFDDASKTCEDVRTVAITPLTPF
jgi:hypothetical protein